MLAKSLGVSAATPRPRTELVTSAPAPRGEDRHGLPRLRSADLRADLRGQRRHDAGGQALRSGARLPPRHLRHVVDSRLDPGIHPAFSWSHGEDGHHGLAEEVVLQSAQAEGPIEGDGGRRPASGERSPRSPRDAWMCRSRTWSIDEPPLSPAPDHSLNAPLRASTATASGRTGWSTRPRTRKPCSPSREEMGKRRTAVEGRHGDTSTIASATSWTERRLKRSSRPRLRTCLRNTASAANGCARSKSARSKNSSGPSRTRPCRNG